MPLNDTYVTTVRPIPILCVVGSAQTQGLRKRVFSSIVYILAEHIYFGGAKHFDGGDDDDNSRNNNNRSKNYPSALTGRVGPS